MHEHFPIATQRPGGLFVSHVYRSRFQTPGLQAHDPSWHRSADGRQRTVLASDVLADAHHLIMMCKAGDNALRRLCGDFADREIGEWIWRDERSGQGHGRVCNSNSSNGLSAETAMFCSQVAGCNLLPSSRLHFRALSSVAQKHSGPC